MGEIAHEEQFLPLSTVFCYLMLDFYVKTGIRFSLRDKRLFEITEVEITRVDCRCLFFLMMVILWNRLPAEMVYSSDLDCFKREVIKINYSSHSDKKEGNINFVFILFILLFFFHSH